MKTEETRIGTHHRIIYVQVVYDIILSTRVSIELILNATFIVIY